MSLIKIGRQPRRRLAITAGVVFYLTLLVLGSQSGMAPALGLALIHDKLLHLLAYGALAGLLFLGLSSPPLTRSLLVIGVVAVLGAADELIQSALPHRDADVLDWVADLVGATLACVLLSALRAAFYRPAPGAGAASRIS